VTTSFLRQRLRTFAAVQTKKALTSDAHTSQAC
jgi:hypothetical protein